MKPQLKLVIYYAVFSFSVACSAFFISLITAPMLHEPVNSAPGSIESLLVTMSPFSFAVSFNIIVLNLVNFVHYVVDTFVIELIVK